MNDLAPTAAVPAPVTPATDRLIRDSTSANTRRAYAGTLARLDASLDARPTMPASPNTSAPSTPRGSRRQPLRW